MNEYEEAETHRHYIQRVRFADIGNPKEIPAPRARYTGYRRDQHEQQRHLNDQPKQISRRRYAIGLDQLMHRTLEALRIIGKPRLQFGDTGPKSLFDDLVTFTLDGEWQHQQPKYGDSQENREGETPRFVLEPLDADIERALHLAEDREIMGVEPRACSCRIAAGDGKFVRNRIAATEVQPVPVETQAEDLRVKTASLVITGRDDRSCRQLLDRGLDFGVAQFADRQIDCPRQMTAVELLWIADIDKEGL